MPNDASYSHCHRTSILIVDDQPDSLRVLAAILEEAGYFVRKAASSQFALKTATTTQPDLILLDVNMPVVDGYETCRQLKRQPQTQTIPIIFVSALEATADKLKAFEAGGVDYITKPFNMAEVLARVSTQLRVHQLQHQLQSQAQALQTQNAQLQLEIRERNRIEAELRQTEAKYRSIFENASEGIFQMTTAGQYLSVNPALAKIYGYESPAELMSCVTDVGQQIYSDPQQYSQLISYLEEYGQLVGAVSEVCRKDGSKIWVMENLHRVQDTENNFLYYEGTVQDITERRQIEIQLHQQRLETERLLTNMLPQLIAKRLKTNNHTIAEQFDQVGVLFADLVGFTATAAQMPAHQLVNLLNEIFSIFDHLVEQHGLEKIKTIGDAYMVAAGIPTPKAGALEAIAHLALDMQEAIGQFCRPDGRPFELRIGLSVGPVIAGVIGLKKFAYDLWGNTVNVASRMESTSLPGKIQVTEEVYRQLKGKFLFSSRGPVPVRGLGSVSTYFLCDRLPCSAYPPVQSSLKVS
ncbi:MAG: adenylate/guanylate cyclase domain-containing protein [Almyronema sp.]